MKVRVKFSKFGAMKFIGHLDVMRYFQKAIRRAKIDIRYTEGLSPHMIMSFASPLGVGLTSEGEYMDIEINTPIASKEAVRRLNEAGVEGITVTEFVEIPDGKANNGMTLVAAADYILRFRKGHEPETDWQSFLSGFYAQKEILTIKKSKRSEKEINIRPMIYAMSVNSSEVYFRLVSGSVANLKPELVMDTYLATLGIVPSEFSYEIHRLDLFADLAPDGAHKFVALSDLGKEIRCV